MANYWLKLYYEILHDRKMATLDDRIWRRAIECFLFAGEEDKGGYLPPLVDVAYTLRVDEEQLETEFNELVKMRVLEFRDGLYFVRKFSDRQRPLPKAEYMRRKRNEGQLLEYYQPVTNSNIDKIRLDIDIDKIDDFPRFISAQEAQVIYTSVTTFATFPSGSRANDIERIYAVSSQHPTDTVEYLKPYYQEWIRRKYNKSNTNWLDWAVTGEIPADKKKVHTSVPTEEF